MTSRESPSARQKSAFVTVRKLALDPRVLVRCIFEHEPCVVSNADALLNLIASGRIQELVAREPSAA